MTIDRSYLPSRGALVLDEWPEWDNESIAKLCAPLSGTLDSPRAQRNPDAGKGYALAPKVLAGRVERVRVTKLRGRGGGKYE